MDVVADLLALVAEDAIRRAGHRALHEVGEKAVQHGAGVVWPGQAAAAEDARPHAEIAAVLLHQHVGGHLRGPEQRVGRLIDAHRLVDAVRERMRRVDLPARLLLDQRQPVRRVAVDLVGRGEDEDGVRAVLATGLEQIEGADGVDAEVRERLASGPIVRRLRGGVDDGRDVGAVVRQHPTHGRGVPDVEVLVTVARPVATLELGPLPRCRGLVAEEALAHVVVDADDLVAARHERIDGLRANQSGRPGDERYCHRGSVPFRRRAVTGRPLAARRRAPASSRAGRAGSARPSAWAPTRSRPSRAGCR